MAASRASLWVALAAVALSAIVALAGGRSPPAAAGGPLPGEVDSVRDELDGRLRETAAGVHGRAVTLSELPRLQAAVSTDPATVRDLTQDELAFRPRPGESIEIAQIRKAGGVESLFRSAGGPSPSLPLDKNGVHLAVLGGVLHLGEVVEVRPRDRVDELTGALALSWPVDLTSVIDRAGALGLAAWIDVEGGHLEVRRDAGASGETRALPLRSNLAPGARLFVRLPPAQAGRSGSGQAARYGAALAVLLAGLLVAAALGRRPKEAASVAGSAVEPAVAPAPSGPRLSAVPTPPALDRSPSSVRSDGAVSWGQTAGEPSEADGGGRRSSALSATAVQLRPVSERYIGRYAIVRPLGSGGMADVYLARASGEAGFEKLVALKVLHPGMARQAMIVDHFLDEARLASRLVHPNVVQISDLGRADDAYYIAMEYVDGLDLERLLAAERARGQHVPLKVAFSIVRRICDGLHFAHTALGEDGKPLELVHRDVKSANVFIGKNGVIKIGDFGIAKANQDARVARTEVGQVKGTAAYMAPEHRTGGVVDARADLYSVAAIAYEVFTGTEINLDLVKIAHLGRVGWPHLPAPSTVRPDLPPALDAVIFKALAYDRDDRYPGCEAFEEALEEVQASAGIASGDKAVAPWVAAVVAGQSSTFSHH